MLRLTKTWKSVTQPASEVSLNLTNHTEGHFKVLMLEGRTQGNMDLVSSLVTQDRQRTQSGGLSPA